MRNTKISAGRWMQLVEKENRQALAKAQSILNKPTKGWMMDDEEKKEFMLEMKGLGTCHD